MKYCFDIDGTICTNTNGDYESAKPIENRINLINDLYEKENEIIYKKELVEKEKKNQIYNKVLGTFSDAELFDVQTNMKENND